MEELLASPSVELLEIPQEAEAYEARDEAGLMVTRVTEQINLIPKSYPMRELCGKCGLTSVVDWTCVQSHCA